MIVKTACSLLSVLLGGQVSLVARPVAREPLAQPLAIATAQCEHFALTEAPSEAEERERMLSDEPP